MILIRVNKISVHRGNENVDDHAPLDWRIYRNIWKERKTRVTQGLWTSNQIDVSIGVYCFDSVCPILSIRKYDWNLDAMQLQDIWQNAMPLVGNDQP